jgi:hypothetical protein
MAVSLSSWNAQMFSSKFIWFKFTDLSPIHSMVCTLEVLQVVAPRY